MIYCVEKNSVKVINSGEEKITTKQFVEDVLQDVNIDRTEELKEVFLKDSLSSGYSTEKVEIISEEIYKQRLSSIPKVVELSEIDKLRSDVDYIMIMQGL